jgi:filamentous hemagglutinin
VGNGNFHFTAGTPTGQSGLPTQSSANDPKYVITNPASSVLGGLTPQVLLNNLPSALQPNGNVPFYFDPFTESQQLQQAALAQTGNASFVSGVQWDSKTQVSLADQQKAVLYSNAINYATQNNIQLGQALSQQQINALNAPMLWYVEQTVPDPSCKATGTSQCGTINALMPQVYLPQATQGALAGGLIQGNQVTLTATGTGDADHPNGTVTNTGFISAQQLIINAQQLNNEARNADIGVQSYRTDKQGYTKVTGDEVQPGGFLSAVNYQLNVDRVNSISGQFQQLNADGTVNQAGSQALLDNLQQQLGTDFTQSTAQNHIQQEWVQTKKSDPTEQIVIIAAAIALSIVTAGTAGVALAGAIGATGVTGAAVAAAVGAMASSAFTQLATTGSLDLGTTFEAGAIGGITAGLTQGITYDSGSLGMTNSLTDPNSLANLGGAQSVGNGLTGSTVTQAGTSTATTIGTRVGAAVANSAISAGVQTIIEGGSFGNALKNNLIGAAAAAGANWIGATTDVGSFQNISEHAVLGCAAAALSGSSCSAGAVGGATSAVVAPVIGSALGITNNADRSNTINQAAVTALAALAGGSVALALGLQTTTAMTAAQNEAINNYLSQKRDGMTLSEQEQFDNAQKNGTAGDLGRLSAQRDADLNAACAVPGSPICSSSINAAQASGNSVRFAVRGLLGDDVTGGYSLTVTSRSMFASIHGISGCCSTALILRTRWPVRLV